MSVDDGVSAYVCKSCGSHGRLASLARTLAHYRDENYNRLVSEIEVTELTNLPVDYYDQDYSAKEPEPLREAGVDDLFRPAWNFKSSRRYLQKRGIGKQTALDLELAYDPDEKRVLFPVRNTRGELFGWSGRTILRKSKYPYTHYPKVRDYLGLQKRWMMLGAEFVKGDKPVLIVEGLFGYAHLMEIGADEILQPVAMMGTAFSDEKADMVEGWGVPVYLMPDNDFAGDQCLWGRWEPQSELYRGDGAVDRLLGRGVLLHVPDWPEGKDDPDQLTLEEVRSIADDTPIFELAA